MDQKSKVPFAAFLFCFNITHTFGPWFCSLSNIYKDRFIGLSNFRFYIKKHNTILTNLNKSIAKFALWNTLNTPTILQNVDASTRVNMTIHSNEHCSNLLPDKYNEPRQSKLPQPDHENPGMYLL